MRALKAPTFHGEYASTVCALKASYCIRSKSISIGTATVVGPIRVGAIVITATIVDETLIVIYRALVHKNNIKLVL